MHSIGLTALLVVGLPVAASAGVTLPPGFTEQVYVTGQGFDRGSEPGSSGVPVATTLGVDASGHLYLAKSGSRYGAGQSEEFLSRVYRIPPGGVRLRPDAEGTFFHGPPLRNPEVGAVSPRGTVFLTTYDPDREIGVVYRVRDGHPALFAGGTPPAGQPPLLKQPEGIAVDPAGHVYVADRGRDHVVKLDPAGKVVERHYLGLTVPRVRMLALDATGSLWIAGDGTAAAPWQDGVGHIWRVGPDGVARLVLEAPHAAAIAVGPGGALFVADRTAARLYAVTPDGRRIDFAAFTGGVQPRSLAFAPVTPETLQAGIAGDLFVVTFVLRTWYLNEVVRISGPFADFVRREDRSASP
jgi:sugar lactone lactonase YvrE